MTEYTKDIGPYQAEVADDGTFYLHLPRNEYAAMTSTEALQLLAFLRRHEIDFHRAIDLPLDYRTTPLIEE